MHITIILASRCCSIDYPPYRIPPPPEKPPRVKVSPRVTAGQKKYASIEFALISKCQYNLSPKTVTLYWDWWGGKGRTGVQGGNFMLGRFFRRGKVRPGFFFLRGKIYTGILFPGVILSRGGFSGGGGGFYAGENSMLQHRDECSGR